MWIITCECGHEAPMDDFGPSCADECTCPKCGASFQVDLSDPELSDSGDEEGDE
jgi:hypothetical protein